MRRGPDGQKPGDMLDGQGLVRGVRDKGCKLPGTRVLVVGAGGVGSAIAASLAAAGISSIHPAGCDLVTNATPDGHERRRPDAMTQLLKAV